MKYPDVTIVIPVLNNEKDLCICLASIRDQSYPVENVEICICDGGSTDKTVDIAKHFGCTVIPNPKRLAEFGVTLGMSHAKGKFIIILAADNELVGRNFIRDMVYPFTKDTEIMLTYPMQVSTEADTWISKYINTFTDPISHFIYGDAANTRTFHKRYKTVEKNDRYTIFDFSSMDYPMIALAQGTTIRKTEGERAHPGDDILPIVDAIADHRYLAYVKHAHVAHHTIPSLSVYFRKQRWAFDNYLLHSGYGIRKRTVYFSTFRKIKKMMWPIYAGLLFPPLFVSLIGYIRTGKKEWLYHFPLSIVSLVALVFEVVRVTILKDTNAVNRKI